MSAMSGTTQDSRQGQEIRDHMATEVVKGEVGGKKHGQEEVGRLLASQRPTDCARLLVVMKCSSSSSLFHASGCFNQRPDCRWSLPASAVQHRKLGCGHRPDWLYSVSCAEVTSTAPQLLRHNRYALSGMDLFWFCWTRELTLARRNL